MWCKRRPWTTTMDDDGWRCTMDYDDLRWMTMDGDEWWWMVMDDDGWRWMKMDEDEWRWTTTTTTTTTVIVNLQISQQPPSTKTTPWWYIWTFGTTRKIKILPCDARLPKIQSLGLIALGESIHWFPTNCCRSCVHVYNVLRFVHDFKATQ